MSPDVSLLMGIVQFECIKTLDGSVMVLAGPGTGKTFTIIQRIKYMLEQGILPESILCLTFSEATINESTSCKRKGKCFLKKLVQTNQDTLIVGLWIESIGVTADF